MKPNQYMAAATGTLILVLAGNLSAADMAVGITRSMAKFEGTVNGEKITIMRNQNQSATVNPAFAKTSRKCPPFCIQPSQLRLASTTIGELEVIEYVKKWRRRR